MFCGQRHGDVLGSHSVIPLQLPLVQDMECIDVSCRSTPSLVFELQPLWRRLLDASHHHKVNIHGGTRMTCGFTTLAFSGGETGMERENTRQSHFQLCRWQLPRVYYPVRGTHVIELLQRSPNREGGNWHRQQPCPFFLTESVVTNVL
jgi:hypothetical protein